MDNNPSFLRDCKNTSTSSSTHVRGRWENTVKEMKDRQPPLAAQQNSCSFLWTGEILRNFTKLLLVWLQMLCRGGLDFYTISHAGNQRTSSTAQAKEGSTFPALCSHMHGRNRSFFFSFFFLIWQEAFIIFLCSPELLLSNKLSQGCTETNKNAIPSPGSLQWNLPVPQAILCRPHEPTQDFKDELAMQHYSQQLHRVRLKVYFILHPTETRSGYVGKDLGIQIKWTVKPPCNTLSYPKPSTWTTFSSSIQGVTTVVLNATHQVKMDWSPWRRVDYQALLPISQYPTRPWLLLSTLWALGSQPPCPKSWLCFPEWHLISSRVSLHQHNTISNITWEI